MGAHLAVSPLLFYHFGNISFIAPLTNILILPVIPIAMALGFIALIISFIYFPFGQALGWGTWAILEYIIEVVKWF